MTHMNPMTAALILGDIRTAARLMTAALKPETIGKNPDEIDTRVIREGTSPADAELMNRVIRDTCTAAGYGDRDAWTTRFIDSALEEIANSDRPLTRRTADQIAGEYDTQADTGTGALIQWIWHSAAGRRWVDGWLEEHSDDQGTPTSLENLLGCAQEELQNALMYHLTQVLLEIQEELEDTAEE